MTRSDVDALLTRHQMSFAHRDVTALADDHTVDGTFESPAHGKVTGRDRIAEVYRYWLTAFPDMNFDWEPPLVEGNRAALFWRLSGTLAGPFFGDAKVGTKIEMVGAAEYLLSPEGIVRAR